MKKLIFVLILFLFSGIVESTANPWHCKTRNKPIGRMTRAQVQKAQNGSTLYTRYKGKTYRNSGPVKMQKQRDRHYNSFIRRK